MAETGRLITPWLAGVPFWVSRLYQFGPGGGHKGVGGRKFFRCVFPHWRNVAMVPGCLATARQLWSVRVAQLEQSVFRHQALT